MASLRPLLHRWHRAAFAAGAAWLALYELRVLLAPDLDAGPLTSRFAHTVLLITASALILAHALRAGRERLAWLLVGGGVLAWSLGELYYTAVLWDAEVIPIPSLADIGFLLMPPLALAGILLLLRARAREVPQTLWVDGVIAALAVASLSAALVFETVLDNVEGNGLAVATNLAYPLGDLVLLGLIVGALAGTGWRLDRTWMLLALGVSTFWLADSLYLVKTVDGTFVSGGPIDTGWWAGLFLIAAAAWQRAPERVRRPQGESLRLVAVPLGFGLVGLVVLVYGSLAELNPLAIALAAASLLAVMARLTLTFRENVRMLRASRDEAMTDALTMLGNRRALAHELEELLPEDGTTRPLALALFDLDGFKHYNDTFGHPAGDALLVRLGGNLAACLEERGHAFRMGGDEFCVLFEPGADDPSLLVESAAAALSETGEGFSIGCSYGSILLPDEAAEPAEALRIADQRMYAQKHAGRMSAGRQSKDVLLRALNERSPLLGGHLTGVADLAERTARRLGLPPEEVERIRHAGELHDAGKVAIPDGILAKPGPLTDEEWAFVRRHPLIGERIVRSAPSLSRVAELVRSTHERWDGAGYPDRLQADAIPLGSRIVAVADAFDAMTSERPYAAPRTPQEALDELRRCAGTQFDPAVVETFRAVVAERAVQIAA
ncbi:MAG: HD domain-containing phosphohydrolase [Solirubrobacteraceae bacterium]